MQRSSGAREREREATSEKMDVCEYFILCRRCQSDEVMVGLVSKLLSWCCGKAQRS